MATNENWPSESCPAHPVSTVAETATIRKISTLVMSFMSTAVVKNAGTASPAAKRSAMPA